MRRIRVLVLSYEPWDDTNSFGNSYSAIWQGMEGVEIANVYCRYGMPNNRVTSRQYQITEKTILRHLLHRGPGGHEVFREEAPGTATGPAAPTGGDLSAGQWRIINWMRSHRLLVYFWVRDLLWLTGGWKCPELDAFVHSFAPDVIWVPVYCSSYMNVIARYLAKVSGKPMIGYVSDDIYTLKRANLSPVFWIDRLVKRLFIRPVMEQVAVLYVITQNQKEEYDVLFHKDCRLLWKGADFRRPMPALPPPGRPLRMIFMGNLGVGRWRAVADVAQVLESINRGGSKITLDIYTGTPLTEKQKDCLERPGSARLMPFLPADQVDAAFQQADILLHVESLRRKEYLEYRLSLSTKLVDYFRNAGCILAYGGMTGSMDYLIREDAGLVVTDREQLRQQLLRLCGDPALIDEYRRKAWECGRRNHEIRELQAGVYDTLTQVVGPDALREA